MHWFISILKEAPYIEKKCFGKFLEKDQMFQIMHNKTKQYLQVTCCEF